MLAIAIAKHRVSTICVEEKDAKAVAGFVLQRFLTLIMLYSIS